ncbi:MAG TPA: alpha/beta hydrolase [Parvibaculum sp.]|jgi:pimeloyl-ACP methyl ester carboxylesterase
MPQIEANGIDIEYESFGPEARETILLIMGLGAQLTQWPLELCEDLVTRGYRVIRFDNRDAGLSSRFERDRAFALTDAFFSLAAGKPAFVLYSLGDMAADAVGLLDALGIEKAHIVGASMGGMIAQLVAAEYPERTLSLTSIMSSSGNPLLPHPKSRVLGMMMSPAPHASNRQAVIARGIKTYETIGSPGFPTDEETLRAWVTRDAARAYHPAGVMRQMAAVLTNGDRRPKLRKIVAPTVVLHGGDDPLVPFAAGEDTAANIEGAELRIVEGMGHDMPLALIGTIADAIVAAAERATGVKLDEEDMVAPAETPAIIEAAIPIADEDLLPDEPAQTVAVADVQRAAFLARVRLWFKTLLARLFS